jgi:glycerate dehydrogenase
MNPNIVFLDSQTVGSPDTFKDIALLGNLTLYPLTTPEQRWQRCQNADVIITNKVIIDSELMHQLPSLKLICIAATGMNCVDLDAARENGIEVKNVAGYSTQSVAQQTVAMLLELTNHIHYYNNYVKTGIYSNSKQFTHLGPTITELAGKRVGIIGLGAIGQQVAKILTAFGAEVVYFSTSGKNLNREYKSLSLNELLQTSDIISIHAPLNAQTKLLIGEKELKLMKPTAILLNTGRGGIVDELALAQAIDNNTIAGMACDVFEKEPLPSNNPLMLIQQKEKIILTPHIAWTSEEARKTLVIRIVENIKAFYHNQ